ncbi:MAG: Crp/Fnr family transcriptional regulator [Vicinamibacterales bacterium]
MESSFGCNQLLSKLPEAEREILQRHAEYVSLPRGATLVRPGERFTSVYFPASGVISIVSTAETGRQCQVAAVGSEGLLGIGTILNMQPSPYWYMAQLDTGGYRLSEQRFQKAFLELPVLRRETLRYAGRILLRTGRDAMCNRFHSHDQRVARWLLEIADKSGQCRLAVTHDDIAQMTGGARHAVTDALSELRRAGAIEYGRGRVSIIDRNRLLSHACDCCMPTGSTEP